MDPFLIGFVFCLLITALVAAMALGQMFAGDQGPSVTSRVERLSKAAEELKKELPSELGGTQTNESLLSKVDLRPLLSKYTGEGYFARLETDLAQADIPLKPSEFLIIRFALIFLGTAAVIIISKNVLIGALSFIPLFFLHIPLLSFKKKSRVTKFSNQLAEFLVLIVNSLRAGQTFMQGAEVAAKESPAPVSVEFKQMLKEVSLGMQADQSMENMLIRVPSEDLKIVVAAYNIQRKVGGNLATILEQTAHTIRERQRIQGQINTLTTQGKLSGVIVALIPVALVFILGSLSPTYMAPLFGTFAGKILIAFAVVLQIIGAFAIKKIVDIDI
jgi:tight adherence protein B